MYDDAYSVESIVGIGFILWFFYFALIIFMFVAHWKIYVKAGKPGWGCIVPVYDFILKLEIACRPTWWIFLMLIPVVNIVIAIIIIIDIAKAFGKDSSFAIGMIFLPIIFYPILAFDSSEYREIEH